MRSGGGLSVCVCVDAYSYSGRVCTLVLFITNVILFLSSISLMVEASIVFTSTSFPGSFENRLQGTGTLHIGENFFYIMVNNLCDSGEHYKDNNLIDVSQIGCDSDKINLSQFHGKDQKC